MRCRSSAQPWREARHPAIAAVLPNPARPANAPPVFRSTNDRWLRCQGIRSRARTRWYDRSRARGDSAMSLGKLSFAVVSIAVTSTAQADDPRCARPPYGGSPDRYRAVLEAYRQDLGKVTKTLEEICRMKFDGADRTALYKLHYKDEEINR